MTITGETNRVKKICIITTRHISYNPRVLKEADAFFNRGYAVTVVTINNDSRQHRFDREIMQNRRWTLKTVNFRRDEKAEKKYWLYLSLGQKNYTALSRITYRFGIAERAALKGFAALKKLALKQKADFYIAHHAEALGIAYAAAKANGGGFGFDAEDFHSGMNESAAVSIEDKLVAFIETKYLPRCTYLTAASKGIGEAYAKKYGLPLHSTILNVFPKENLQKNSSGGPVKFYWYSQVIGPNRSLETLLEAASLITLPFELHLRGSFHSDEYKKMLEAMIVQRNLGNKVFFHSPILAEHIITDAAQYDVGLALESGISVNRNICVTNKIFSYLMSGLAIVGTDTEGQKDIFKEFNQAVCICQQNNKADLVRAMNVFLQNPNDLVIAKEAARKAAMERFNWEAESERLIAGFEAELSQKGKKASLVAV